MSLFAIGDTHLSLGADKPMDKFPGWSDYVYRLEKNWRAVVGERDTVVINGDISWSMKLKDCYNDFSFLNSLPGEKIFIKGNHDYWWDTRKKVEDFFKANGFGTLRVLFNDSVTVGGAAVCGTRGWFFDDSSPDSEKIILRERQRLIRSIEDAEEGKEKIVFLHYPPVYDDRKCEEIYSVLIEKNIKRCYFGHIHGETTGRYDSFESDGIKFALISADRLAFCPRLIQKQPV